MTPGHAFASEGTFTQLQSPSLLEQTPELSDTNHSSQIALKTQLLTAGLPLVPGGPEIAVAQERSLCETLPLRAGLAGARLLIVWQNCIDGGRPGKAKVWSS